MLGLPFLLMPGSIHPTFGSSHDVTSMKYTFKFRKPVIVNIIYLNSLMYVLIQKVIPVFLLKMLQSLLEPHSNVMVVLHA